MESLLAWLSSTSATVDVTVRPLPRLTHLVFGERKVPNRYPITWPATLSETFAGVVQQCLLPALECVDLTFSKMDNNAFKGVLDGLAATCLRVLHFPMLFKVTDVPTAWSEEVPPVLEPGGRPGRPVMRSADQGAIPSLGKVHARTGLHPLMGNPTNHRGPGKCGRATAAHAHWYISTFARTAFERPLVPGGASPRGRYAREVTQLFGEDFRNGTLRELKELSLENYEDKHADPFGPLVEIPAVALSTLRVLRLHKYTPDFAVNLASVFKNDGRWHALEVLDLMDCELNDQGMGVLAQSIAGGCFGTGLEELNLSMNSHNYDSVLSFGPAGLRALVEGLNARGDGPRLRRLSLNKRDVDDAGVAELVAGWQQGPCFDALEELQLDDNQLTDEGVWAMVAAGMPSVPAVTPPQHQGRKRPVLQSLDLGGNEIQGGEELCAQLGELLSSAGSLSWSSSLLKLCLYSSPLQGNSSALFACLGPSLQSLVLATHRPGDELLVALSDAAAASFTSLQLLNINGVHVSCRAVKEFANRLKEDGIFPKLDKISLNIRGPQDEDRGSIVKRDTGSTSATGVGRTFCCHDRRQRLVNQLKEKEKAGRNQQLRVEFPFVLLFLFFLLQGCCGWKGSSRRSSPHTHTHTKEEKHHPKKSARDQSRHKASHKAFPTTLYPPQPPCAVLFNATRTSSVLTRPRPWRVCR